MARHRRGRGDIRRWQASPSTQGCMVRRVRYRVGAGGGGDTVTTFSSGPLRGLTSEPSSALRLSFCIGSVI